MMTYIFNNDVPVINITKSFNSTILVHTIVISNVNIENAILIAYNIKVIFANCNLHNVKIKDDNMVDLGSLFYVQITFINTLFYCQITKREHWYGIQLKYLSVVDIIIKKSSYYKCQLITRDETPLLRRCVCDKWIITRCLPLEVTDVLCLSHSFLTCSALKRG